MKAEILDLSRGLDQCRLDYCAHLRAVAAGHHSDDGRLDLVEEKALLTRAQRQLAQLKIDEQEKRLLPADGVLKLADRSARTVRAQMENIPPRLASVLVGVDDKTIERILRDEIRAALNDASAEIRNDEDCSYEEEISKGESDY